MRNEEPPNKAVHAEDLATALAKLHAKPGTRRHLPLDQLDERIIKEKRGLRRVRSGSSTVVYHPNDHGDNPYLPAVTVEDMAEEDEEEEEDDVEMGIGEPKILAHTARPPIELAMDCP